MSFFIVLEKSFIFYCETFQGFHYAHYAFEITAIMCPVKRRSEREYHQLANVIELLEVIRATNKRKNV